MRCCVVSEMSGVLLLLLGLVLLLLFCAATDLSVRPLYTTTAAVTSLFVLAHVWCTMSMSLFSLAYGGHDHDDGVDDVVGAHFGLHTTVDLCVYRL